MGTTSKRRKTAARKPPSKRGAERRPDERLVNETVRLARRHDRRVSASLREIGEHVLRAYFFADDLQLARSNDPTKPRTYALLAARAEAETDWTAADFRRAVRIAIVARTLRPGVAAKLAPSKLLRLYAVDDTAHRAVLAKRVAEGELDEAAFRIAVAKLAGTHRRGGRQRNPGAGPPHRETSSEPSRWPTKTTPSTPPRSPACPPPPEPASAAARAPD